MVVPFLYFVTYNEKNRLRDSLFNWSGYIEC